jgi:signal transduction histidine kinase
MPARTRLLTVDDNALEREIMAQTLAMAFPEAEICSVSDPTEVEGLCGKSAFDCVLIDYNMPEMDGLTLARALRAVDSYLPIVMVTSVGDEMLVAEAIRSGISDYIVKSRVAADSMRRIVDRTVRAAMQARLIDQQHEELENFAYALAHDFKQPIRQIITFSQMLADELSGVEVGSAQKHLAFLGHAATRLDALVDVMVQYTLLSQPPKLSAVNLNRVLAAVGASLATLLEERGAEIVAIGRAPSVQGNETLMNQVLQNLIVNGIRYNKSATPRVELSFRRDAEDWVLAIRDNGIGISAEYLADIFKPLIRLHSAKEYPGTGLGLTLARKAILAQQGKIWCESTPGQGSTFFVRLAAGESRAAKPRAKAA